jgi:signal transduction histidine kinase
MNLIQWGALDQAEFAESTNAFSSQLGNVRTMLENVLNWSISQMGGIKPKFETCSVQNVINEELTLLSLSAKNKTIKIKNLIDESLTIKADKNHLAFIFRNLVQNAIKFSNMGGEIALNATKENDKIKISVSDNGVGMSDETLNKLFKLDQTNSKIGTNAEKGTGLGLILTKEFVEANGGSITVESREGIGTTFILVF